MFTFVIKMAVLSFDDQKHFARGDADGFGKQRNLPGPFVNL